MLTTNNRQISVHRNNSLVFVEDNLHVFCASGSMRTYVGLFIGQDGNSITHVDDALIYYILTGVPGSILIIVDSKFTDHGVYTCRIPNENGVEVDVNIGIYPPGFNGVFHCTYICSGYMQS